MDILHTNDVDIMVVTETELPAESAPFAIHGYVSFFPTTLGKSRVMMLVKTSLATEANAQLRPDLMDKEHQSVWVQFRMDAKATLESSGAEKKRFVVGGVYRQWTDGNEAGLSMERAQLATQIDQFRRAAESEKSIVVMGDFNLDTHRTNDHNYNRKILLHTLQTAAEDLGLRYLPTQYTWRSHGRFGPAGEHKYACLDHIYVTGVSADVRVLTNNVTDHRPVVASVRVGTTKPKARNKTLQRRNFKQIGISQLEAALESACDWDRIHTIKDVNEVHDFLVCGISVALDLVAPFKAIKVKEGGNLYLAPDTLALMRARDGAKGNEYRRLRNRVSALVKRDKITSNLTRLKKSNNDPKVLWQLANEALGNDRPSLPAALTKTDGSSTDGDLQAATSMNQFYIDKIDNLRSKIAGCPPAPPSAWPRQKSDFEFSFASAGKIAKVVKSLSSTEALGVDKIPVSVLKKGIEVLASPIAHLVNRSLASGVVPSGFKKGIIHPVHKGGGKSHAEPASYRPVSILPAMSKILETVVKQDLEKHLAKNNALPGTQYGFRPGRSCTSALASAHARWLGASPKIVGIMAFDLSAAFDTVNKTQLIPKLEALGIGGQALAWFASYMSDGLQCVDWNDTLSDFVKVKFGVRQGSILGPLLYLVHVADLTECLKIGDQDNSCYADDSAVWSIGKSVEEVITSLSERVSLFVQYAKGNGLALNASKTQLLFSHNAGNVKDATIMVDGISVSPSLTLELLGVTFDRKFSTSIHEAKVAVEVRKRASMVARLAHHLPRGNYLRQLSMGLVLGKVSHALAAVATPRLSEEDQVRASAKSIQVAINDVARTLIGTRRSDHMSIHVLLGKAGLPSLNEMVTTAVAMEAWKAFYSDDGGEGQRNLVGQQTFETAITGSRSRAATAGEVRIPLRGHDTFVSSAAHLWNKCPALRLAKSVGEAKRVSKLIKVPL